MREGEVTGWTGDGQEKLAVGDFVGIVVERLASLLEEEDKVSGFFVVCWKSDGWISEMQGLK